MKKRIMSLLLVLCMLFTMSPVTVLAEEVAELGRETAAAQEGLCAHHTAHDESCGYVEGVSQCSYECAECLSAGISFSSTRLALKADATAMREDCGTMPVQLTRFRTDCKQKFTVVVFDTSANYGADYTISYDGTTAEKFSDAQSIFDAFKNGGELVNGIALDLILSAAEAAAETMAEQSGEEQTVSAADMLEQLDELEARAVEITVTFDVGVATQTLNIHVIDDGEVEYQETFMMAVLDEEGEVIEGTQQNFSIVDNEDDRPSVTVSFDCESQMELTDDNKTAVLTFVRTGDLATSTLVTLNYDGEAYGQVDFAPYQQIQQVEAVVGGVYTLEARDGVNVGDGQVEVFDNTTTTYTVEEGGDAELDAIPDAYAIIRTARTGVSTAWMPKWAKGEEGSTETQKIITSSDSLYDEGGGGAGGVKFFVDGTNLHNISTRRSRSTWSKGHRNMDLKTAIDLIGVESVETTVMVDAIDSGDNVDISFGIEGLSWNTLYLDDEDEGKAKTFTVTVPTGQDGEPDYRQASKKVYYSNVDPDKSSAGTDMYVPNALKLNLRKYRFVIESDPNYMAGLNNHMTYAGSSAVQVPKITEKFNEQILTINSKTYATKNNKVVISYDSSDTSQYPARLVGFCVKKYGDNSASACSEMIKLDGNSFTFDEAFLRKYEMDYCVYAQSQDNGEKLWTFHIIPIYEKIYVGKPTILSSTEGDITVESLGGDCLGDQWIIRKTGSSDATLSGVWYQGGNSNQSSDAVDTKTTYNHYKNENNAFVLDIDYRSYKIQGVWSTDAARLLVFYENNAANRGKLQTSLGKENEVVSEDSYVVGTYIPLMALPDDGYYTRWHVKGSKDYYYGDVFYYQLDGNPDHNIVYVDFLSEAELKAEGLTVSTRTLEGSLKQSYVEARNGNVTQIIAMDETTLSVNSSVIETTNGNRASVAFSDVTNKKGEFTLENFKGVEGGTYSVMVLYKSYVSYTTITYSSDPDAYYSIQMPQFASDQPYPYRVNAYVSGESTEATTLIVSDNSVINATTRVHVPAEGSTVTGVTYFFANETMIKDGTVSTNGVDTDATKTGTDGNGYEIWSAEIKNSSKLTSGMKLFVVVYYTKTDDIGQTHQLNSGNVDTGYMLATAVKDTGFDVIHEIPSTLGMRDMGDMEVSACDEDDHYKNDGAYGRLVDNIDIPILGILDFSFTSKNGGFFTTRSDENGNTYMMCGSSALNYFGTGTITQKLQQAKELSDALAYQRETGQVEPNEGGSDVEVPAMGGTPSNNYLKIPESKNVWTIEPAYLFMITISENSSHDDYYVSSFLASFGVDAFFTRCFPFSIYGVPLYVSACFTTELYYSLKLDFAESQDKQESDIGTNAVKEASTKEAADEGTKVDTFIAAPVMKITMKGGVGFNGFCSLYLTSSISAPFIIQFYPGGAASCPSFTVGFGADLAVFNVEFDTTVNLPPVATSEQVMGDLKTILGQSTTNAASVQSTSAQITDSETSTSITDALRSALSTEEIMEQLNNATFSPIVATEGSDSGLRTLGSGKSTIDTNVFKNTGVHLLKQDGKILAFYLQDTRGEDNETLNYLSVAYAVSTDGGASWTKMGSVSSNTGGENTSLQYGIDLYDLGDGYTLLTWSEANFDEMLDNTSIDINRLTPAQVAKFMNAMSLKGKLLYHGELVGETFTISTNDATVYCGALDAVMNDGMLYVYYQRNIFPETMKDGTDVTLADILNTTRTIALARAEISGTGTSTTVGQWSATQVRAMKNEDQEYRITEVEPFVHNGVMGEILVLDRDGKLAEWDAATETWTPSNEDRQLYLRTYTFDEETGEPIASALMAISDSNDCCENPQVVSNEDYLHLFWNCNGEIVYISDFVAMTTDSVEEQRTAYVVVNPETGEVTQNRLVDEDDYGANHIASDDEHLNIGSTFSASMDDDGHVLLSWVATDVENTILPEETEDPTELIDPNEVMSEEVFGVVLETVSNADVIATTGSGVAGEDIVFENGGNADVMQLRAKGSPIALTNENSDVGALDSVFLGDVDGNSNFLLAFSTMNTEYVTLKDENGKVVTDGNGNEQTKQKVTSADVKSVTSEYATDLAITSVSAPEYPEVGKDMTVTVTVSNKGLKEARNVSVSTSAKAVADGNATIESILPGRSKTIELKLRVSESFNEKTDLIVQAVCGEDEAVYTRELLYGAHFTIRQMPSTSNVAGTFHYDTVTTVYNEGNAEGTPTLYYKVSVFNGSDKADDEKYTIENYAYLNPEVTSQVSFDADGNLCYSDEPETRTLVISAGSFAMVSYTLEDTPVTSNDLNGTLTVYTVDPDDDTVQMKANQYMQGQMSKLKTVIEKKSDVPTVDDDTQETPDTPVNPNPSKPSDEGSSNSAAQKPSISFNDVPSGSWCEKAVDWAVENGITNGTSASTFSPDDTCTRAEAVTFLWRAAGSPEPVAADNPFTDVSAQAYYYKAVLWAVENGITNGTSAVTFSPDDKCLRGQIVTFLWRAADSPKPLDGNNPFADVGELEYHQEAVLWAVENGITNGISPTTFGPNEQCSRAQIVTFLYRYSKG